MSKTKKKATRNVASLATVLGIEPAVEFELLDRVFEARAMTLGEQMLLAKALEDEKNPMTSQADVLTKLLNTRLVDGEELSGEDVLNGVDLQTSSRLLQLLQGQRRARTVEGDEGK